MTTVELICYLYCITDAVMHVLTRPGYFKVMR